MVDKIDALKKKEGSPCFKESYNPGKIVGVIRNRKVKFLLGRSEEYLNLHSNVSALEVRFFSKWGFTCLEMIRQGLIYVWRMQGLDRK